MTQAKGGVDVELLAGFLRPFAPAAAPVGDAKAAAAWLEANAAAVATRMDEVFAPFDAAYLQFEALLARLVEHYKTWLAAEGCALPVASFLLTPPEAAEPKETRLPFAPQEFAAYLGRRGLVPSLLHPLSLQHFWTFHRPIRAVEIRKDQLLDCACGRQLSSKPFLAMRSDPVFGDYVEPQCKRCATS